MLKEIGKNAVVAAEQLKTVDTETKNQILDHMASELVKDVDEIIDANKVDLENAKQLELTAALTDRLTLNKERIQGMSDGLKKIWIGFGMTIDGEIIIDEGAEDALLKDASLLSKGVLKVNQTFEENSGVEIKNTENTLIGRGVVNLSSKEIEDSKNSENTVVIHKDNLLIL